MKDSIEIGIYTHSCLVDHSVLGERNQFVMEFEKLIGPLLAKRKELGYRSGKFGIRFCFIPD